MKNIVRYIFLLCFCTISYAQVGIGTVTPNGSSILDVSATDKGILIPRMTLAQRNLISSPVEGLLIYQTNNTPGFYYYNGSIWTIFSTNTNSWSLSGNTGTNPSSNFIGTTDAQDVAFRTANIEKMRLSQLGQLEFSNSSNSIFIGAEAGENDNQTDNTNIGLGYRALYSTTNGYDNIAIGRLSLTNNTTGRDNTAIGEEALISNLTGFDNIALGDKLLTALTSGNNNIAIGDRTLISTNGNFNLAIGSSAGETNLGSSNIFLGYNAGRNETGSNKLYIENSGADADNALVYGEFDTNILRANGQFQIGNPTTSGYALPTNRGTANQVLTTAGNGSTSWQLSPGGAQEINDLTDAKTLARSVYLGNGSGNSDSSGDKQNSALGNNALTNSNSGIQNVAIGESTMLNNNAGERNTAVGQSAMRNNTSGNRNTVIGEDALYSNSTGSGNVAIGNLAGRNETGSDKLYIENSNADANNALVYGEFDNNILRVNGEVQIGNPTGTGYALPTNQGAASQVLTTAGDGTTSWAAVGATTPSIINANTSTNTAIPGTNTWTLIPFDTENIDTNSEFNTTTSQFTATSGGYYRIYVKVSVQGSTALQLGIFVGGTLIATDVHLSNSGATRSVVIDEILNLNTSDTVEIQCRAPSATNSVFSGTAGTLPRTTSLQIQKLN